MNIIRKILRSIIWPVLQEPVFFFVVMLMFSFEYAQLLHAMIVHDGFALWLRLFKSVCFTAFVVYVLTLIITLSGRRIVKIAIYVLAFLFRFTLSYLLVNFGTSFTPAIIQLIVETNVHESLSFIQDFVLTRNTLIMLVVTLFLAMAVVWLEKHRTHINRFLKKAWLSFILAIPLIVMLIMGAYDLRYYWGAAQSKTIDTLTGNWQNGPAYDGLSRLYFSVINQVVTRDEMDVAVTQTLNYYDNEQTANHYAANEPVHVVLVIGESFIRTHASIYNYPLPTTPNLQNELTNGNLFAFDNVIAPYNYTSLSVKNIMSCNSMSDGERWQEKPMFAAPFACAGFVNLFWSNQWQPQRGFESSIVGYQLNSVIHHPQICSRIYTRLNQINFKYDDGLINDFINNYKSTVPDTSSSLAIIHLMGQHFVAGDRFPDKNEFKVFSASNYVNMRPNLSHNQRQDIADYDNAVHFGDHILGMLFDFYRDKNAAIVFLSDHGEEIWDFRNHKGRDYNKHKSAEVLHYQHDIPFIIWCSSKYLANYPELVKQITKSLHNKFMTDNTCQVLFSLAHLDTPLYHAERDLISSKFTPTKKGRIVCDGYNYDEITSNK